MRWAPLRSIDAPRALRAAVEVEDFEQEIVDQYASAMAAAGLNDGHVRNTRAIVVEFARWLARPLWTASCEDADRFLAEQRRARHSVSTRAGKAGTLALFYEFVIGRYQGDPLPGRSLSVLRPGHRGRRPGRVPAVHGAGQDAAGTGRALGLAAANRYGQQLFFANTIVHRRKTPRLKPAPRRRGPQAGTFAAKAWRQDVLFELAADPQLVRQQALATDSALLRHCRAVVAGHSTRYG